MNTSLSLSFELIFLMGWLLKNEKSTLDALVKHALKNGLGNDLKEINPDELSKTSDQLYSTILDFLVYLEESLAQNLDATNAEESPGQELLAALKNLGSDENLNISRLKVNMQKTKTHLTKDLQKKLASPHESEQAKKVLFENIIKNWKPSKNEPLN